MDFIIIPFGWLMRVLYSWFSNYGVALLLFTIITRFIMLPLSISQQKTMAKTSVYQPLIDEVNKKYANNREKQQEEMMKLYNDYGIKPSMGCGPLIVQMIFVLVLYQVIQKPLRFFVGVGSEAYNAIIELAKGMDGCPNNYIDTFIISKIQSGSTVFDEALGSVMREKIASLDFSFFGIKAMDLTQIPSWGWNLLLLIPIASAVSMILSQFITTRATGQKMQGASNFIFYAMSIWIGYLGFTFPAALSLYWFYSNILGLVQTLVLKKYVNPEKYKAQIQAELEAKRAEKKRKKTVTVTDEATGEKTEKVMNDDELARLRLAKARALQEEHFRQQEAAALAAEAAEKNDES